MVVRPLGLPGSLLRKYTNKFLRGSRFVLLPLFLMVRRMLLSCSAKKVTKEGGIGEALRLVAPAPEPPSPMYPTRRALTDFRRNLTGITFYLVAVWLVAAAPLSPLCRFARNYTSGKKSGHFLSEQDLG